MPWTAAQEAPRPLRGGGAEGGGGVEGVAVSKGVEAVAAPPAQAVPQPTVGATVENKTV